MATNQRNRSIRPDRARSSGVQKLSEEIALVHFLLDNNRYAKGGSKMDNKKRNGDQKIFAMNICHLRCTRGCSKNIVT